MNGTYYAVVRSGDSLSHFGVVGMRCGIRHDNRVKAAKRLYKTNRKEINRDKTLTKAQKQKKIAGSREQWMKEREKAANRLYSLNGKSMNSKIARQSVKKTVAKTALMGSGGSAIYDKMRATGSGRLKAGAFGVVGGNINRGLGRIPSLAYYAANVVKRDGDGSTGTQKKKKRN